LQETAANGRFEVSSYTFGDIFAPLTYIAGKKEAG